MARIKKQRIVESPPLFSAYKPSGVMRGQLQQLPLALDEYEAIRLADYQGMDHAEAAEEMEISRSTFSRLIEQARHKMSLFLIEGRQLYIEGGNIHFRDNVLRCQSCGHMFSITMDASLSKCPECGSAELLNLAGGFGHGRCCARRNMTSEDENYEKE